MPGQRTVRRRTQRLLAYFTLPGTPGRKSEIVFIQRRSSKTDSQINSLRPALLDTSLQKAGLLRYGPNDTSQSILGTMILIDKRYSNGIVFIHGI